MPGYTYQKWRDADGDVKPSWRTLSEEGRAKYARAIATDRDISRKAAREIAATIRGWPLEDALEYLKLVMSKNGKAAKEDDRPVTAETPLHVPYRKYTRQVTHRRTKIYHGPSGRVYRLGGPSGRYPVLAAKEFLRALRYAQANAEERELDIDLLRLEHVAAHLGRTHMSYFPRAHGRATDKKRHRIHIEVILREDERLAERERAEEEERED